MCTIESGALNSQMALKGRPTALNLTENTCVEHARLEMFDHLKEWMKDFKQTNPFGSTDECFADIMRKCATTVFATTTTTGSGLENPLESASNFEILGWNDLFLLDQMFFGTGGDYLLGEYGRPQLMQLVHVDPFVVYAHRNSLMTPIEKVMLMLPPLVKGVVTDRGVFTFNVDSRAETSDE